MSRWLRFGGRRLRPTPSVSGALVSLAICGCRRERLLNAQDCAELRAKVEAAWSRDALSAEHLLDTDAYSRFIAGEQKRIGQRWQARCSANVGTPVDARELACLQKAQTIDDVQECAEAPGSASSGR